MYSLNPKLGRSILLGWVSDEVLSPKWRHLKKSVDYSVNLTRLLTSHIHRFHHLFGVWGEFLRVLLSLSIRLSVFLISVFCGLCFHCVSFAFFAPLSVVYFTHSFWCGLNIHFDLWIGVLESHCYAVGVLSSRSPTALKRGISSIPLVPYLLAFVHQAPLWRLGCRLQPSVSLWVYRAADDATGSQYSV